MTNLPKARQNELVERKLENETLIYDLKTNKAFCLNETSALIWQMCDGTNTVSDISKLLSQRLNLAITEDLIWLALDGLKKDNLLEKSDEFEINFNNSNRRQVIKKVGLASMVMLPIISSIVAPNAAMAASSCVNPSGFPTGEYAGRANRGNSFCNPNAANDACTSQRGSSCCSGIAFATTCDEIRAPGYVLFLANCQCA